MPIMFTQLGYVVLIADVGNPGLGSHDKSEMLTH